MQKRSRYFHLNFIFFIHARFTMLATRSHCPLRYIAHANLLFMLVPTAATYKFGYRTLQKFSSAH